MNMLISSAAITTAPSIAIAGPDDDRQLLDLEKQILEAHDAAMAYDEDIWRCVNAWHDELDRLRAEGRAAPICQRTKGGNWSGRCLSPLSRRDLRAFKSRISQGWIS